MNIKDLENWKKYGRDCDKEFVAIFEDTEVANIVNKATKTGLPVLCEYEYRKQFYRIKLFSYYKLMCFLEILLDNVGVDEIKLRILHGGTRKKIMEWNNE